ncbi:alpha/beta hydrolase family domain-containing protein [Rhizoctonia solani AG-1 IA]|uniref:Alpha/beta hydrolase family domain-containing protein n=1 Tax=Thanatephorus cucumeris (strain AG1-IA) TaxID=983506 RepID=L8WXB3_THACA|nr:alpha/beta hydrolase family domain-containing protein [Rhizoctonia solani AG-1 IA]
MSFNLPSFVPNQVSATLRSLTDRGFQSPLNVALATAIPLIALYSTLPALSSAAPSKPKVYPSLGNIAFAENSRLGELKKHANKLYPADIYGPGDTVELTKGEVKYWIYGPEEGKKVVLIHGLSIPSIIWKEVATRLSRTGFRVLLFDLYGRGYSEAPDARTTRYDVDLYITQLALLMQYVGWKKARIVGLSMVRGGGIAAAFAAKFPWLVDSNVGLIASVGVMEGPIGGTIARVFGSAAFQRFRHSALGQVSCHFVCSLDITLTPSISQALFTPVPPPEIPKDLSKGDQLVRIEQRLFGLQSAILPGYTAAVAASVFMGPLRGLENEFTKLGELEGVRVQIIWGTKDAIVSYKYADIIKKLIPHAELVTIEGAGHDLCATHYETLTSPLLVQVATVYPTALFGFYSTPKKYCTRDRFHGASPQACNSVPVSFSSLSKLRLEYTSANAFCDSLTGSTQPSSLLGCSHDGGISGHQGISGTRLPILSLGYATLSIHAARIKTLPSQTYAHYWSKVEISKGKMEFQQDASDPSLSSDSRHTSRNSYSLFQSIGCGDMYAPRSSTCTQLISQTQSATACDTNSDPHSRHSSRLFVPVLYTVALTIVLCPLVLGCVIVVSAATAKPVTHPSLGELDFVEGSRFAALKDYAKELYPIDLYGPGKSIRLTKGRVHYWLIGPKEGRKVRNLVNAGFRVLIYDLYGRGYSEGPDAKFTLYDTDLYVTQLALLMQAIGWHKAQLVGMSMGGGIAAAFASKLPWLVDSNVVLIGSAGVMENVSVGPINYTLGSVSVQRLYHSRFGKFLSMLSLPLPIPSTLSYSEQERKRLKSFFKLQIALFPGYYSAIISSVRLGPVIGLEKEFEQLGKIRSINIQLIWGTKDTIVPFKYADKIKVLIPRAKMTTVENAGHVSDLFINHKPQVTKSLIDFLDVRFGMRNRGLT